MTKQLMIYENAVPIRSDMHRDTYVRSGASYAFARPLNSAPLLVAEFMVAAVEFPIVFIGEDENVTPAAILGLRDGENLFVDAEGKWTAPYFPAFFRRYPFVFAQREDQSLTLCIDQSFEGVNTEGRGERLFDAEGNRTEYLGRMLGFASSYQQQFERTKAFCARLVRLDLLEPAQARFAVPGQPARSMSGFRAIRRERLRQLPQNELAEMFANDDLELCFHHLVSLGNVEKLIQALSADNADAGAEERPAEVAVD